MMIIKQGPYIFHVCNKRYSGSLYCGLPIVGVTQSDGNTVHRAHQYMYCKSRVYLTVL